MDKILKRPSKSAGHKENTRKVEKEESVNGWWYPKDTRMTDNLELINKNRHISKSPQYCNSCEKTWQRKPSNYSALSTKTIRNTYDFYDKGSLPTYRLERRLCPLCTTI